MHPVKKQRAVLVAVSLTLLTLLVAAGCTKNEENGGGSAAPPAASSTPGGGGARPAATAPQGGGDTALIAAGKTVFAANGCAKCHAVGGQGGRGGPDLSRTGAQAGHTAQWLVEHIKNPKAHNPSSRMPGFQGKISDKDLLALGAYLASLK